MLPTLANDPALVITSSRPPHGSPVMAMLDARTDDGRRIIHKCDWRRMCLGCQHREESKGVEVVCNHVGQRPLPFRSRTAEANLKPMMRALGNDAYNTEILNQASVSAGKNQPFFDRDAIDAVFATNHTIDELAAPPRCIQTSIDPGTVHGPSPTAIVTTCFAPTLPGDVPTLDSSDASQRYCIVRASPPHLALRLWRYKRMSYGGRNMSIIARSAA